MPRKNTDLSLLRFFFSTLLFGTPLIHLECFLVSHLLHSVDLIEHNKGDRIGFCPGSHPLTLYAAVCLYWKVVSSDEGSAVPLLPKACKLRPTKLF